MVWQVPRRMPLRFGLITVVLWIIEIIGPKIRVWPYLKRMNGWSVVPWQKFGAWLLPMVVSYVLVTLVSRPRAFRRSAREACGANLAPASRR